MVTEEPGITAFARSETRPASWVFWAKAAGQGREIPMKEMNKVMNTEQRVAVNTFRDAVAGPLRI
jgi:hypothetical protein